MFRYLISFSHTTKNGTAVEEFEFTTDLQVENDFDPRVINMIRNWGRKDVTILSITRIN